MPNEPRDDTVSGAPLDGSLSHPQQISQLVHELEAVRASTTYRFAAGIGRVAFKVVPAGSRRHKVLAGIARNALRGAKPVHSLAARLRAPRTFSLPEAPRVSIVIPIHGKWAFTRDCLTALHATESDIPFEIIVVDDASPDSSRRRLSRISGIRVVPLDKNQGYVGASNAGIAVARGEFVVFLNNDTRVTPQWLGPLVSRLEDPSIGLVGAKLIYPDGSLQDAGGIVFADGNAWNYGKHCLASAHDYEYARDADYVSGACTVVRKVTLDALGGGLDPLFAPAYYDDVDLAFGVRSLGMRVVYEPRSVVIHDEGISHGIDETTGVKRYQLINRDKFVAKWGKELESQPPRDPLLVPWAARRRNGERVVVVIDDALPTPDVDAGSVRRFASLVELRQLGYHVILSVNATARPEPYLQSLQTLGIEVLGPLDDPIAVFSALSDHVAAIIVARAPVAVARVFALKGALPGVPIIFDTVDLHFLREDRARSLRGDVSGTEGVDFLRRIETAVMRASDLTLVVSEVERELLADLVPECPVRILSTVHSLPPEPAGIAGREGIVFVGSFAHPPNIDAVEWYLDEVHPLVRNALGPYPVRIIGKGVPERLLQHADPDVIFEGWVADLTAVYDSALVAIAPLRYGAGVKGKIGEALSHGVPMVMTPVGSEGMHLVNAETAMIGSDAQEFAEHIVRLVQDHELWQRLSASGRVHVDEMFGTAKFRRDLVEALEAVGLA